VNSEPLWRWAPYIWTHQYTFLSPRTCFVLDDGTGRAVGYCIGCPDVVAQGNEYGRYVSGVLERDTTMPEGVADAESKLAWLVDGEFREDALAQTAGSAHWLWMDGNEDLLGEGYRATMHIDLLDEWQGKGWGRKLIDMFVESVRGVAAEGRGIWIGVGTSNAKVVPFYEKQGFRVKTRAAAHQKGITMVRDF
jgi:GNAT superfamily N-acetyltransferase